MLDYLKLYDLVWKVMVSLLCYYTVPSSLLVFSLAFFSRNILRTVLRLFKAHANGRNIVGQQHATLLGPTCCVRLHGATTMLALAGTCCV